MFDMKKARFWTLLLALVCLLLLSRAAVAGGDIQLTSPNGFPIAGIDGTTVNCTFFADGMAYRSGWRLNFLKAGDARTWAANVTNANKSMTPTASSIMVLDAFPDSPRGHVGWVTSSQKNRDNTYTITVMEGFKRGTPYGTVNTRWNYYQHTWTISAGTSPTATVSGGTTRIAVLGFLTKK